MSIIKFCFITVINFIVTDVLDSAKNSHSLKTHRIAIFAPQTEHQL